MQSESFPLPVSLNDHNMYYILSVLDHLKQRPFRVDAIDPLLSRYCCYACQTFQFSTACMQFTVMTTSDLPLEFHVFFF